MTRGESQSLGPRQGEAVGSRSSRRAGSEEHVAVSVELEASAIIPRP